MKKSIALIAVVLLGTAAILYAKQDKQVMGGRCVYEKTAGICRIVSVGKTDESIAQAKAEGGPGYEGNLVKFTFNPIEGKDEDNAEASGKKEYTLKLTNSWYPGDRFLAKYDIRVGEEFNCLKRKIIKGTCTPVLFKFPDIDTSDYFEAAKQESLSGK